MKDLPADKIVSVLKKDKNIILAYIFGSTAKKEGYVGGDVDIAVLLKNDLHGMKKLAFLNKISPSLERKIGKTVDVVVLNQAPVALKQQVLKYGQLLFERKKGLAKNLVVQTITAHLDYLNILNFFNRRVVQGRK